jgi:hypothetical protein
LSQLNNCNGLAVALEYDILSPLALKTQISNPTFEEFEILLALPDIFP